MTVTVYRSTDVSAPTLTGQVGSLTTLLDALLVNGYGFKASQGWTIAYTATNQRSYLMPSGTNQRYLNVEDTIAAGAANYSRIKGYEAMTAFDTGTNPFPTALQFSGGLYFHKSTTADATARPWYAYGNGSLFYLFVQWDTTPYFGTLIFGDFLSYVPGDVYNTIIIAAQTAGSAAPGAQNACLLMASAYNSVLLPGHYICRGYTGFGGSIVAGKFTNSSITGVSNAASAMVGIGSANDNGGTSRVTAVMQFPNAGDNGLYMERFWLTDYNTPACLRGELPGLWAPQQIATVVPFTAGDSFAGANAQSGKTFDVIKWGGSAVGHAYLETSDTW